MHINFFTERCTPAWVHWFLSGDQQEPFKRILQGPKHSAKLFVFAILYCYWNITTMIECIKVFFFPFKPACTRVSDESQVSFHLRRLYDSQPKKQTATALH